MAESSSNFSRLLKRAPLANPVEAPAEEPVTAEESEAVTITDMTGGQAMRPAGKNLTRIHMIDRSGKVRTFQYSFLDAESHYEGGTFTLLFAGTKHWQVTVRGHGKMFWAVYDYICLHRWPYLREATGSMPGTGGGDETTFTEISFKDVTPG